jgi:hypothetical protein
VFFFFQKKKKKALFRFAEALWAAQPSAKPTLGVWGRAPSKFLLMFNSSSGILLFSEKEAKSVVPLRGSPLGCPTFGEADPGGLGACPQQNSTDVQFVEWWSSFSRKRSKKRSSASQKIMGLIIIFSIDKIIVGG